VRLEVEPERRAEEEARLYTFEQIGGAVEEYEVKLVNSRRGKGGA